VLFASSSGKLNNEVETTENGVFGIPLGRLVRLFMSTIDILAARELSLCNLIKRLSVISRSYFGVGKSA
jgi:hypothetical protein